MKRPVGRPRKTSIRKKPVRKRQPIDVKLNTLNAKIDHMNWMAETKINKLGTVIETLRTVIVNSRPNDRQISADLKHVVDQMGRSLSDQIHILYNEAKPIQLINRVTELERRLHLLEYEVTNLVKNIIKQVESRYQLEKEFRERAEKPAGDEMTDIQSPLEPEYVMGENHET